MTEIILGAIFGTVTALIIGSPLIYLTWKNVLCIASLRQPNNERQTQFEQVINKRMAER